MHFFFMENHYKTFFIFILFLLCVCKFCYITVVLDLRLFMTINLYSTVFVLLFVSNVPGLWNIFKTFVMIENLLFLCLFVLYSCSNVPAMFPDYERSLWQPTNGFHFSQADEIHFLTQHNWNKLNSPHISCIIFNTTILDN